MSHVIATLPDVTLIYLAVSLIATLTYTGVLYLRGLTASLLHVLTWGSTYALVWPGTTAILSVLGIWYRFLPGSSTAFSISAIISLLPAAGVTSLALRDAGSSPLARKADRPASPPPPATVPPPTTAPPPRRIKPKWG